MEIFIDKKKLRSKYKEIRRNVLDKKIKSEIISKKIIGDQSYKNSNIIAIYNSFGDEVDTSTIIKKSLELGKIIAIPKVFLDNTMLFYRITDFNNLVKNNYGIKEPNGINVDLISKENIDLFIVPGICFDKKRNRVGFGKGYYDKYLVNTNSLKIGICFDEQILSDYIKAEKTDVKMDVVITDKQKI